ncbi:MAG: hypothetical protein UZ01_03024 [Candidatus Brocadia sinica]|nr:MAG: hypothetical protein UZ01_03024 [Candidatus Brocadia sinica]
MTTGINRGVFPLNTEIFTTHYNVIVKGVIGILSTTISWNVD